ncbi:hypothetical protein QJQ45_018405, partial [Haematococcus lacustris]
MRGCCVGAFHRYAISLGGLLGIELKRGRPTSGQMAGVEASRECHALGTHMSDLSDDVFGELLRHLPAAAVGRIACTCKRLNQLTSIEASGSIWEHQCQRWLDEQSLRWGQPAARAQELCHALRLRGFRSMYRGLSAVGPTSPVGLWWLTCGETAPERSAIPGLIALGVTNQAAGVGPPLHCLTAHSLEWQQV